MGGAALRQAIQAERASGTSQAKDLGASWGVDWDTFKAMQVSLFPKTPPNRFWLEKYHETALQEKMRRRRLTLAPIPKELPHVFFKKNWKEEEVEKQEWIRT
jgi:hypothetical protein